MVDIVTREVRSRMMRAIQSKNTSPERIVRSALHAAGMRFRLGTQVGQIRPDVVLPRWHAAVFVHGCFWHRHTNCRLAYRPQSKQAFWDEKFRRNVERDERQYALLREANWRVLVIWECALRQNRIRERALLSAAAWVRSRSRFAEIPVPIR